MAIIQTIRDKYAKVAGGVVVLALVGFIVGGTDVRSFFVDNETIAKVNGEKINIKDFDKELETFKNQYKANNQIANLDADAEARLTAQAWDQFINEKLMNDIYEKLGIRVTEKEFEDLLEGDFLDPQIASQFTNQQTGQVDRQALQQGLENFRNAPENEAAWKALENDVRKRRLQSKLVNMIAGSVYMPKYLLESEQVAKNSTAQVQFVNLPYTLVPDAEVKTTDEELTAYMNQHSKMFVQKTDARSIEIVSFTITPTAEDTAEAVNGLNAIKDSFAVATSDEALRDIISFNSSTQSAPNYVKRDQLNSLANAEEIWNAPNNTVVGPFYTEDAYMIAKTIEKRSFPDSVKYRHIVVVESTQGQNVRSIEDAKLKMDSAIALLNQGGAFDTVATKFSDDQGMAQNGGSYNITLGQKSAVHPDFGDFVFSGKPGERKLIKVDNGPFTGYQYVEIISQSAPVQVAKFAFITKDLNRSKEATSIAYNAAVEFNSKAKDATSFDATALEMGISAMPVGNILKNNNYINGVGTSRDLAKWVYSAKVGDVSNVFTVGDKYIVAILKDVQEKGKVELNESTRQSVEFLVKRDKKAKILAEKNNAQTTLEAIATANTQIVQTATDVNLGQAFHPTIGNEPRVIGYSFSKQAEGQKMSKGIKGNNGVYYIVVDQKTINPAAPISAQEKQMSAMQLRNQLTGQVINGLKEKANIEDKREKFY